MASMFSEIRALTARCATALVLVSGCSPTSARVQARTPHDVVREFTRALGDGKASAAYALMSPEYRQRVSLAAWQKNFEANPQEVGEAERRLAHAVPADDAHMQHADGQPIALVQHEGRWFIASEEVDFYDQSTPRAALRSLVSALTRKRYDVLVRLMPASDKEGVTDEIMEKAFGHATRNEIEPLLSQLRANVAAPIEIMGERAVMPYADHRRVQFVREAGRWCIQDAD